MSGNNHGYYYAPTNGSYPVKHWSEWTAEQQQYYVRGSVYDTAGMSSQTNHTSASISPRVPYYGYTPSLPPPPPPPPLPPPSPNGRAYMNHRYQETSNDRYSSSRRMPEENRYQDSTSDRYSSTRRMTDDSRYPTPNSHYTSNQPSSSGWNRSSNYKRQRTDSEDGQEPKTKSTKKKKKPLSQNTPSRKDWKKEEAEMALACEKEYNKRHRNQSLIIKFPDLELNKDIVSKFHGAIENVHFQQPSTARFCFVTLERKKHVHRYVREEISTLVDKRISNQLPQKTKSDEKQATKQNSTKKTTSKNDSRSTNNVNNKQNNNLVAAAVDNNKNNSITASQVRRAVNDAQNNLKINRPHIIIGESVSSVKTVSRSGFLYISRMSADTEESDLTNHLKETAPGISIHFKKLKTTNFSSSFQAEYPLDKEEVVFNPKIWPGGASIRKFIFKKPNHFQHRGQHYNRGAPNRREQPFRREYERN